MLVKKRGYILPKTITIFATELR